jgi:hypothetical protein
MTIRVMHHSCRETKQQEDERERLASAMATYCELVPIPGRLLVRVKEHRFEIDMFVHLIRAGADKAEILADYAIPEPLLDLLFKFVDASGRLQVKAQAEYLTALLIVRLTRPKVTDGPHTNP